jgi:hypothetical protein
VLYKNLDRVRPEGAGEEECLREMIVGKSQLGNRRGQEAGPLISQREIGGSLLLLDSQPFSPAPLPS